MEEEIEEMEKKLIELVKPLPILYNWKLRDYRNPGVKSAHFHEIGKVLGITGPATKKLWMSLKGKYKRHLEKTFAGAYSIFSHAAEMEFCRDILSSQISGLKCSAAADGGVNKIDNFLDLHDDSSSRSLNTFMGDEEYEDEGEQVLEEQEEEEEPFCVFCRKIIHLPGSESGKGPGLLEKELKIVFIVYKLLGVSRKVSENLLVRFGNPSNWIRICWACEDLVNESKSIFDRIQHLERSLQKLKNVAEKKIRESENKPGRSNRKIAVGAAETLRKVVLKGGEKPNSESVVRTATKSAPPEPCVKLEVLSETEAGPDFFDESENPGFDDMADDFVQESVAERDEIDDDFVQESVTERDEINDDSDDDDEWVPGSPEAKRRRVATTSSSGKRCRITASGNRWKDPIKRDENGDVIYLQCQMCKLSYPRPSDLYKHYRSVHDTILDNMYPDPNGYTCEICNSKYTHINLLNKHRLSKHVDSVLKCEYCPKVYLKQYLYKLKLHVLHYHERDGEEGNRSKSLPDESSENDGEEMDDLTGENDENKTNEMINEDDTAPVDIKIDHEVLDKDQEDEGFDVSLLKCNLCPFEAAKLSYLYRHKLDAHWEIDARAARSQKMSCKDCDVEFENIIVYRQHCLVNHKKMKACPKCPRLCIGKGMLSRHLRLIHKENKLTVPEDENNETNETQEDDPSIETQAKEVTFSCDQCDFILGSQKEIDFHVRDKHWIVPKLPKSYKLTNLKSAIKCTICDEEFTGIVALRKHCVEDHKMFHCPPCNRLFTTKTKFKVHNGRKHFKSPASKPFKCDYCPRRFMNQVLLNYHLRICHWIWNGTKFKKPKKCSGCERFFIKIEEYSKHIVNEHGHLQCNVCPRICRDKFSLDMHMSTNHHIKRYPVKPKAKASVKKKLEEVKTEKETPQERSKPRVLECPYCKYCAFKRCSYNQHMELIHYEIMSRDKMERGDKVNLKCDKCAVATDVFNSVDELLQHKFEIHKMVKCDICLHCLPAKGYLETHIRRYHSESSTARFMAIAIKSQSSMRESRKRQLEKDKTIRCKDCVIVFDAKSDLIDHNKKEHPDKMYKCDQCPESDLYESWAKVYQHKVMVHNEPCDPYRCHICNYTAGRFAQIERHKASVHYKTPGYICEICSNEYRCTRTLQWHKIKEHGLGKESNKKFELLVCKYCNRTCSSPYYLKAHVRTYHLKLGRYKCPYEGCGTSFMGQKQVDVHVRLTHMKELPYACHHCGKKFGRKNHMENHIARVHLPKEHKCDYCDYATNDKTWLKRHMEVHENNETRPYLCNYCGVGFPVFRYLTQHFGTHIRRGEMQKSEIPSKSDYESKLKLMGGDDEGEGKME